MLNPRKVMKYSLLNYLDPLVNGHEFLMLDEKTTFHSYFGKCAN